MPGPEQLVKARKHGCAVDVIVRHYATQRNPHESSAHLRRGAGSEDSSTHAGPCAQSDLHGDRGLLELLAVCLRQSPRDRPPEEVACADPPRPNDPGHPVPLVG